MKQTEPLPGIWQFFMLILSILSLVLIGIEIFMVTSSETAETLRLIDNIICAGFFGDFLWQLVRARPLKSYLKWGWLDLISSIPMIPALRIARLARIIRIVRLLRCIRSFKQLVTIFSVNRARNSFTTVLFFSIIVLLFSLLAIMTVEPELHPGDAFWWCLFLLITGEYGDFLPSSTEGRIITTLLMTAGVAIFGTFTAFVASFFLEEDQVEDEQRDAQILREIQNLAKEVADLKKQIKGENSDG